MVKDEITRPVKMDEFIAPDDIKNHIASRIQATKTRNKTFPHTLIDGPAGTGKTTLAGIIANELQVNMKVIMCGSVDCPDDITDAFVGMKDGDIVFFDEVHNLKLRYMEILYTAMEQGWVPKIVEGMVYQFPIKDVCIIIATNMNANLPEPLTDRCKNKVHLLHYTNELIRDIILLNVPKVCAYEGINLSIESDAALELSQMCKGTPRVALGYLDEVIDYASVHNINHINQKEILTILTYMGIDSHGLTSMDRRILFELYKHRKLSLPSMASLIGQSTDTIKNQYEPYLLSRGLISIGSGGRKLTFEGWNLIASGTLKGV